MNIMGTGKNIYGHKREGNTEHGDTRLTVTPLSQKARPAPCNIQWGGALEASRDMDRWSPGQCPFRDPWQSRVLGRPRLDCLWGHGHDFPVYDGGLVLTRTWILPRHQKTHSLQLSPVVSGATAPAPALYGHDFPVYDGGLVLTRTWILPRHQKTHSLQLSPVVSGATAPAVFNCFNKHLKLKRVLAWLLS